ncbi:MAG: rod-binding protein [Alphaproteobacteria bacterium]|nr:rod-binding protein [Alphaproteobacteria bacterium]
MTGAIAATAALDPTVGIALNRALPTAPPVGVDPKAARNVATQFESVFITQMLGEMFNGLSTDGPFGGGQGEAMFRSLMMDEYGRQIASQGGFGLADAVTRQLLKHQEIAVGH